MYRREDNIEDGERLSSCMKDKTPPLCGAIAHTTKLILACNGSTQPKPEPTYRIPQGIILRLVVGQLQPTNRADLVGFVQSKVLPAAVVLLDTRVLDFALIRLDGGGESVCLLKPVCVLSVSYHIQMLILYCNGVIVG